MEIKSNEIFQRVIDSKASDLHLSVGIPPLIRINKKLSTLPGYTILTNESIINLLKQLLDQFQLEKYLAEKELDFSFGVGEQARFRANSFFQKGFHAASFRIIPYEIPSLTDLNLPPVVAEFAKLPRGFVLITGSTGHGKSSTIASLIDSINKDRAAHILTIEDPIEYVFKNNKSLIQQREMNSDTRSWQKALKSVLREDSDVVLVGEMRDYETISATITIAETGHLVFSTLHTNTSAQSVNRLIDVFPENQQAQIKSQLADSLEGIISQRLVPSLSGGLLPAVEVLVMNNAVRSCIREGKTHLIDNIIATNLDSGMISLERSLATLVNEGKIDLQIALSQTLKPDEVKRLIK